MTEGVPRQTRESGGSNGRNSPSHFVTAPSQRGPGTAVVFTPSQGGHICPPTRSWYLLQPDPSDCFKYGRPLRWGRQSAAPVGEAFQASRYVPLPGCPNIPAALIAGVSGGLQGLPYNIEITSIFPLIFHIFVV